MIGHVVATKAGRLGRGLGSFIHPGRRPHSGAVVCVPDLSCGWRSCHRHPQCGPGHGFVKYGLLKTRGGEPEPFVGMGMAAPSVRLGPGQHTLAPAAEPLPRLPCLRFHKNPTTADCGAESYGWTQLRESSRCTRSRSSLARICGSLSFVSASAALPRPRTPRQPRPGGPPLTRAPIDRASADTANWPQALQLGLCYCEPQCPPRSALEVRDEHNLRLWRQLRSEGAY